ncbi:MAG TPA: hypothetical protein VHC49_06235 [Mycobacteriales bacterium]|nr:hypothetical protein [Mycobacteriales bacterium]
MPATTRLSGRTRKTVLVLHIVSVGAWIGMDVVLAILVFTALLSNSDHTKSLCYQALELFAVWPLFGAGLVCLATGVVLGVGSKYGVVRFWWVALKLALNLLMTALVLISLRVGIPEVAEDGRRLAAGEPSTTTIGDVIFPPVVAPLLLLTAVVLSVFKPWGRIRTRTSSAQTPTRRR